jgi:hypothetical protein
VLFKAGDHVPTILLFDVDGNVLNRAPEQIAETCVNVGVINGFTVTVVAVEVAEQLLLFVTKTVYEPEIVAVKLAPVAPEMFVPLFFH